MDIAFFPPESDDDWKSLQRRFSRKRGREALDEEENKLLDLWEQDVPTHEPDLFSDYLLPERAKEPLKFFKVQGPPPQPDSIDYSASTILIEDLLNPENEFHDFFAFAVARQKLYTPKTIRLTSDKLVVKGGAEFKFTESKTIRVTMPIFKGGGFIEDPKAIPHAGPIAANEIIHPTALRMEIKFENPWEDLFDKLFDETMKERLKSIDPLAESDFKKDFDKTFSGSCTWTVFMCTVYFMCEDRALGEITGVIPRQKRMYDLYKPKNLPGITRAVIYVDLFVNRLVSLIDSLQMEYKYGVEWRNKIEMEKLALKIDLLKKLNSQRAAVPKALFLIGLRKAYRSIERSIPDNPPPRGEVDVRLWDCYLGNASGKITTYKQALLLRAMYYSMGFQEDAKDDDQGLHGSLENIERCMKEIVVVESP